MALRSAHQEIVVACGPETMVSVAGIVVIPVAAPVRCSVLRPPPTTDRCGVASGDRLLIGRLPAGPRACCGVKIARAPLGGQTLASRRARNPQPEESPPGERAVPLPQASRHCRPCW